MVFTDEHQVQIAHDILMQLNHISMFRTEQLIQINGVMIVAPDSTAKEGNKLEQHARTGWAEVFFNTLEWLGFLINNEYINNPKIIDFFSEYVISAYEATYQKLATEEEKNDPKLYKELKTLYKSYTDKK